MRLSKNKRNAKRGKYTKRGKNIRRTKHRGKIYKHKNKQTHRTYQRKLKHKSRSQKGGETNFEEKPGSNGSTFFVAYNVMLNYTKKSITHWGSRDRPFNVTIKYNEIDFHGRKVPRFTVEMIRPGHRERKFTVYFFVQLLKPGDTNVGFKYSTSPDIDADRYDFKPNERTPSELKLVAENTTEKYKFSLSVYVNKTFFTELQQKMITIYGDVRKKEADEAKAAAAATADAEEKAAAEAAAEAKAAADAEINKLVENTYSEESLRKSLPGNEMEGDNFYNKLIALKYEKEEMHSLIYYLRKIIQEQDTHPDGAITHEQVEKYLEDTKDFKTFLEFKKYFLKQKIIAEYEKKNIDTEIKKNRDEIKQYWDKKTEVPPELTKKRDELDIKFKNIKKKLNEINSAIDLFIVIVSSHAEAKVPTDP